MSIKTVPYLKWRDETDRITPADHRIGNDLLLVDSHHYLSNSTEPFRTDMTTAIIYERGWSRMSINMKEYMIEAPKMVILLDSMIIHPKEISPDLKIKVIIMSKTFSESLFSNLTAAHPLYRSIVDNPVMDISDAKHAIDSYYLMLSDLVRSTSTPFRLEAAQHLTLSLFYGYFYEKHDVIAAKKSRNDQIFDSFIALLRQHYRFEREVGFYARKLCLSAKYLSRAVMSTTGKSALMWIDEYVIAESKALLLSTDWTVQQIGNKMNFSSQALFGKYFKRVVGLSPSAYRKTVFGIRSVAAHNE